MRCIHSGALQLCEHAFCAVPLLGDWHDLVRDARRLEGSELLGPSAQNSREFFLPRVGHLGDRAHELVLASDRFEIAHVDVGELGPRARRLGVGGAEAAKLAVRAVRIQPRSEHVLEPALAPLAEHLDVLASERQLIVVALGHYLNAIAQHLEAELDAPGPRVKLAGSDVVDARLKVRLDLLTAEELASALVVGEQDSVVADPLGQVDVAEYHEAPDRDAKLLLDAHDALSVELGPAAEITSEHVEPVGVVPRARDARWGVLELALPGVRDHRLGDAAAVLLLERPRVQPLECRVNQDAEVRRLAARLAGCPIDVLQAEGQPALLEQLQA